MTRVPPWWLIAGSITAKDPVYSSLTVGFRIVGPRRPGRLLPVLAAVSGAKDGGPQMPSARSHKHGTPVTRIEHDVVRDVTKEGRPVQLPSAPTVTRFENPRPLSRRDEQDNSAA